MCKSSECFVVNHTLDDYQCSGNLKLDLKELCTLMGMKDIPNVKIKQTEPPDRGIMGTFFHLHLHSLLIVKTKHF